LGVPGYFPDSSPNPGFDSRFRPTNSRFGISTFPVC
jgi:hypothetical protein